MKAVRILRAKESLKTLEADMRFLGRRARLALVGLFGGEMKLNLISMPTRAYKIVGIDNGSIIDLEPIPKLSYGIQLCSRPDVLVQDNSLLSFHI